MITFHGESVSTSSFMKGDHTSFLFTQPFGLEIPLTSDLKITLRCDFGLKSHYFCLFCTEITAYSDFGNL